MVTLRKEFFEAIRPHQVTIDCSKMWTEFDKVHEDTDYETVTWYGNHGLPVLPCYEVLGYKDGGQDNVLFLTREQYEILCNWWETTEDYILVSEKYNQFDIYAGDIDEIFVFNGENSELISCR